MRYLQLFFSTICLIAALNPAHATALDLSTTESCLQALDSAAGLYDDGDFTASKVLLDQLDAQCRHLPQIQHNQGVLAANARDWETALRRFRLALQQDARAEMTRLHLQSIYRYRAGVAYSVALNAPLATSLPQLTMQDSTHVNADSRFLRQHRTRLHKPSTVEYELYDWWGSTADVNQEAWLAHYVDGYPPLSAADRKNIRWEDVHTNISFTSQDAVAIVTFSVNKVTHRMLLLMRLQGNRWKIYQETLL